MRVVVLFTNRDKETFEGHFGTLGLNRNQKIHILFVWMGKQGPTLKPSGRVRNIIIVSYIYVYESPRDPVIITRKQSSLS